MYFIKESDGINSVDWFRTLNKLIENACCVGEIYFESTYLIFKDKVEIGKIVYRNGNVFFTFNYKKKEG